MFKPELTVMLMTVSALSACQSVPAWKHQTSFPFRRPIVEAMCEIADTFNGIRKDDAFPKSYYVVTVTLESKRQNKSGAGVNASYQSRDGTDRYVGIALGSQSVAGLGADETASRTSTTPITFKLTDLGTENIRIGKMCVAGHAIDTDRAAGKEASLGLGLWFKDVMYAAPVGVPDNVATSLRLERNGGASLFPSWKFVRGVVDPDLSASYANYDDLKIELKLQNTESVNDAGTVKVTRGGKTTDVPAMGTETYRNMLQPKVIIQQTQ